ncbi:DEAD-domain-containing protein [Neoconidiobolus thromboides FSU 785]|nr:DEAD-domain-containing protein [Neoconidiobolus thromboides FSU 785]
MAIEDKKLDKKVKNEVEGKKDKSKKEKKNKAKKEKKENKRKVEEESDKENDSNSELDKKAKKEKSSEIEAKANNNSNESGTYVEHEETSKLSTDDIQKFREKNSITYNGDKDYKPILKFNYAGFSSEILEYCKNFKEPTPIQSSCWPIILNNRDVVGIAQTGSGKTLAFTLPALMHIKRTGKMKSKLPTVLILAPTRELAMQSYEICEKVGQMFGIRSTCIYGGVPKDSQRRDLKKGVQIIIATPGRLLDLIEDNSCDISQVNYLVLDEADRMLDFGFEPAIRSLISKIHSKRQTVMLSATWPETIRKLANEFLSKPIHVTIGSEDLAVSHNVTQIVEVLDDPFAKDRKLIEILRNYHKSRENRVLVFVLYKKEAAIQGDLSQNQRTEALARFKDGTCPLLIATDVAARGLDIPKVEYVINYTFPLTIDDYVHRIGRTGRAGNKGISHTFFTAHDKQHSGALINVLKSANQDVPENLLKFGTTVKKKEHKAYGAFFKDIDENAKPTKIVFD